MSHATRPDLPAPEQSGTIAGYRLDRCIGQGSAAAVYLAQDERQERLRRRVALKVMAPELARDAGFRARMIRESRAAAALDHPHVIPVFEADEAGGTLYVAMRYVAGRGRAVAAQPARAASARLRRADHRPDRVRA